VGGAGQNEAGQNEAGQNGAGQKGGTVLAPPLAVTVGPGGSDLWRRALFGEQVQLARPFDDQLTR